MALQVSRILHHERSKFQDVLVFQSATYGNVLVLDGAIQATERDEFSYQEMIAHLPLASHPNPKRVLVIGGGDGGVLREVVKHPSVEEVILCDIDEAVPRVSTKYLPKMAAGFADPKTKTIIGDGFAFLKQQENKAAFDVIITDSSDPIGPAEALFQPPFFKLLKEALKPGGHISTQGESMWCHLEFIQQIRKSVKELFPVAEYAFTTIPTYPSGQIGFIVASLDANESLRKPLREIPGCRYWSPAVHEAAFSLPEFARRAIIDGEPAPGPVIASGEGSATGKQVAEKKILLLGTGYVARPFADYITRTPEFTLTAASTKKDHAEKLVAGLPRANGVSLDVNDTAALEAAVAAHDVVVSLIPYTYHADVIKAAIKGKTDVVTTSYVSDAIRALEPEIKQAGITVVNEIGLDPGLDHLYAVKAIEDIHQQGGKITSFLSYCGGLPAPEAAANPLGYKFSWSSRGVLLALRNTGKYWANGEVQTVSGVDLMASAKPFFTGNPAFNFVCYPNRDSTPFREWYGIPEAQTVIRGTLRYGGFPELVLGLVKLGFLDDSDSAKEWLTPSSQLSWPQVVAKLLGESSSEPASLQAAIEAKLTFKDEYERQAILQGLRWLGFFDSKAIAIVRGTPAQAKAGFGNPLDTLCATLEEKCAYAPGERDMVMLQHRFEVQFPNESAPRVLTSSLLDYGHPMGYSSMARLVGVPCGVATRLLLEGNPAVDLKSQGGGIWVPYTEAACKPLRDELVKEGIALEEKWI